MKKKIVSGTFVMLFLPILFVLNSCNHANLKLLPDGQLPILEPGVLSPPEAFKSEIRDEKNGDLQALLQTLQTLIQMTQKRDYSALPGMISKKKGIFIDLKAHVTYDQLVKEVAKQDGYFENFYFHTARLRKFTGDDTQIAVRDLLLSTRRIRVDLFKDSNGRQCEMKLHLLDHPELDFRLNNPVFIKEGGVWKVYALF